MIGLLFIFLGDLGRWLFEVIDKDLLDGCRGKKFKKIMWIYYKEISIIVFRLREIKERKCVKN